jgi:regulator of sigma E protease
MIEEDGGCHMNVIVALLILSIIVIVHELGHFLLAKKNGITVTEFSVGMGPRIASFVRGGTRYSLKLFPIGGSCMMLGEDDTMDDAGAFNNKGVWARFSVLFAGPFFNFILAFVLAIVVLGAGGVDLPVVSEVQAGSPAQQAKIQVGDRVTAINGSPIHLAREVQDYSIFSPFTEKTVTIRYVRDKKKYVAQVKPEYVTTYQFGCSFNPSSDVAAKIGSVSKNFPIEKAGLKAGDVIVNINGISIKSGKDLGNYLAEHPLSKQKVKLTYQEGGSAGKEKTIEITPKFVSSAYVLGWNVAQYAQKLSPFHVIEYSFYEVKYNIVNTIKSLGMLIARKISLKGMSGPIGIVNIVGNVVTETKSYGISIILISLVQFSIMLSANLGVMNLLPLPALDGGRLVFVLIEAVRGKPVPKEKEALVHMIGMAALMVLMVFVMYNDIRNLIR